MSGSQRVLGLIPAAGGATRLGSLPCSKEILPIGINTSGALNASGSATPPRIACAPLLKSFRKAGIRQALVILRRGKWDVPDFLGDGGAFGIDLAFRVIDPTASVAETLDQAYPFFQDARVALGFPDIAFEPRDAFAHLLQHLDQSSAEVVLALVPAGNSAHKADLVETAQDDTTVLNIAIKQAGCTLEYAWTAAVWKTAFSHFLHEFVADQQTHPAKSDKEIHVGYVFQAAIEAGLKVEAVRFPHGSFLDIGTPEDLRKAILTAHEGKGPW